MKNSTSIYLLALILSLASPAHATSGGKYAALDARNELMVTEEAKYGFVDVQKILTLSYAGKEAKAKFDSDVLKAEMEKNSRGQELTKLNAQLEKHSIHLSETERFAKRKIYEQRLQEYQQFMAKTAEDLRSEDTELTRGIVEKIGKTAREYGRMNGFVGIFFKNDSMLYLSDKVDITDEILKALNEM
ncbi:OmpH family outer membrane protein [Geomonas azotofigens]|uniref:OmpH family outer membrane protein n=1 Tax=Geomonas azotofigens TaxID=2843196 RepID=UPI001C0FB8BF|nr:OmpH family outer membrane protein [Geomonas azotofigens]MBU5613904.1 OmpH family outer membrane protein [Geomonas azotofigens]